MADEARPVAITSEVADGVAEDQRRQQATTASSDPLHDTRQTPTAGQPGEGDSLADVADATQQALLMESEQEPQRLRRAAVTQFLDSWWGGAAQATVLDYSGGIGTDTLHFAATCRAAYYFAASPQTTSQITAWALRRFAQQGAAIATVTSPEGYDARFDALVAFEALDGQLNAPSDAQLDALVRLTRTGGLLFLTAQPSSTARLDARLVARGCQAVTTLADGAVRVYVKGPALTVAVPVYNAYEHVCRLLASLRATTPGYPLHWLFVNDASPDPRISALLQSFARDFVGANQTCAVIERAENRGFPLTANQALEAAGSDDVILLNSDTRVYDAWARKLVQAAYADARIGTVTPLCNNASIYSVFKGISVDNHLNTLLGLADLPLVEIPVGVGFCLYLKRELLERVGVFDPIFGQGYGEETDLCLRASEAGYRHVLAPSVFIYHAGSASMVEAQVVPAGQEGVPANTQVVMRRYPQFSQRGLEFAASGTTGRLQRELANRYITYASSRRPSIGIVVYEDIFSSIVGGTPDHLRDMVRELGADFVFYFITPSPSEDGVVVTAYVDGVRQRIDPSEVEYSGLLAELNPSLIHIHHLMNFSASFIEALTAWNGPKYYSIHDYFAVCKQYNLLNYKGEFCNVPGPEECGRCALALWGNGYSEVATRRARIQKLIDTCSLVIAPSATALGLFRKAFSMPDARAQVLPHPMVIQKYRNNLLDPFRREALGLAAAEMGARASGATTSEAFAADGEHAAQQRKAREATLRVGVVGYNAPQKGTMLVKGIIAACAHDPILFVSIGDVGQSAAGQPNVISTGRYERMDVVELIEAYKVDLIIVASIWPETFCYTVSEAWMAGVPVLTGPLGAQAERVRATGAGIALDDLKVKTFVQALRGLLKDRTRLDDLKIAAAHVVPATDYDAYRQRYLRTTGGVAAMTHMFSAVWGQPPAGSQSLASVPLIAKLVGVRKRVFPVGSGREKLYFWLHDRVTRAYAGRLHG